METDLQDLLRDGLADVSAPPGLGASAHRRWRRRRRARQGGLTAGTAGLAVVLVASVTASGGPPGASSGRATAGRVSTVAYVKRQVIAAAAASAKLVEFTVTALAPGSASNLAAPSQPGGMVSSPRFTKPLIVQSEYGGRTAASFYAKPGAKIFTGLWQASTAKTTTTFVTYSNRTWWRQVEPTYPPWRNDWCSKYGVWDPEPVNVAGGTWEQTVRSLLTCPYVQVDRTSGRIDGQHTIELSQPPASVRHPNSGPTLAKHGYAWAIWVNPATYLPVRLALWSPMQQANRMTQDTDFQWLRPTKATLAPFHLTVPPGYKRVSPPVG